MQTDTMNLDILSENKRRGKLGEKIAKNDYENNGYSIILTRFGSDFVVYKKIGTTLYQEYVEVKTGRARQSATQRRKMRIVKQMGLNYTVYRITDQYLRNYSNNLAQTISKKQKLYSLAGGS